MNPKLNVCRLVRETRLEDGVLLRDVLTLRDPHGKIMRTARTRSEEEELKAN